jgi:hypothetical protein
MDTFEGIADPVRQAILGALREAGLASRAAMTITSGWNAWP